MVDGKSQIAVFLEIGNPVVNDKARGLQIFVIVAEIGYFPRYLPILAYLSLAFEKGLLPLKLSSRRGVYTLFYPPFV